MAGSSSPPRTPKSPKLQPPLLERAKGPSGLDKIVLRDPRGFTAEVRLYGGQVTSWKNEQGDELLFVSSKAVFKSPGAIRGGIPICFPQFGTHGNLEKHGFARNRLWLVDDNPPPLPVNSGIKTYADLILKPSEEDLKIWPHRFEFRLRVALGPKGDLFLTSRIRNTNTDGKPFSFTFAYHTYFSVSDIRFFGTVSISSAVLALVGLEELVDTENQSSRTTEVSRFRFQPFCGTHGPCGSTIAAVSRLDLYS